MSAVCLRGLCCVGRRSAGGDTLPISCMLGSAAGLAMVLCVETDVVAADSTYAEAAICIAGGAM